MSPASLTALNADTKLSALTVSGTTAADTLKLTGSKVAATINLGGDTASVTRGPDRSLPGFHRHTRRHHPGNGRQPPSTLPWHPAAGSRPSPTSNTGWTCSISASTGAASSLLKAANTLVNGQNAISIYSSGRSVARRGPDRRRQHHDRSNLLTSHLVISNGNALIN